MKSIAELNKHYAGKLILIIGEHPMKGQDADFVEMVDSDIPDERLMKVKLKLTGEETLLHHTNAFIVVKRIVQQSKYN